jgi:hypothetical protein
MHAGHKLTAEDRAKWLERNGFDCPVYKAKITAQTCASNRKRPLLTEAGLPPADGAIQLHRNPKCNDDCPTWLGQRDKYAGATGSASTKRGVCAWCGRTNMAIVNRGLDGACYKLFKDGVIEQGEDGSWREVAVPVQVQAMAQANAAVSSAFGPLAEAVQTERTAPIVDTTGTPVQVPAGDIAAALANPDTILHMPGQAPPVLMGADPDKELITEAEASEILASARAQAAQQAPADDDWEDYTGRHGNSHDGPMLIVDKSDKFGLSAEAVKLFDLAAGERVRLRYSRNRRQIGVIGCDEGDPGALVIQGSKSSLLRISAQGFCSTFRITPRPGSYPLHREPSGLLVATIELESEEAKAS